MVAPCDVPISVAQNNSIYITITVSNLVSCKIFKYKFLLKSMGWKLEKILFLPNQFISHEASFKFANLHYFHPKKVAAQNLYASYKSDQSKRIDITLQSTNQMILVIV